MPNPSIHSRRSRLESLLSKSLSWFELLELSEELNTHSSPELEEHLVWVGHDSKTSVKFRQVLLKFSLIWLKKHFISQRLNQRGTLKTKAQPEWGQNIVLYHVKDKYFFGGTVLSFF